MKVGVVTINDITNFGNRLQNYALCRVLRRDFGCRAVTLEPVAEKRFHDGNIVLHMKERAARALCAFPSFAERRFGNNMTRFAAFAKWNRNIPTRKFYDSEKLPRSLNEKFDMFFVGSDQVWNPLINAEHLDDCFLSFADVEKRAAISASIGMDALPYEFHEKYKNALAEFPNISVRENAGRDIIFDLTGEDVPVLCDPVMMLDVDEWLRVAKKPRVDVTKPYVLKYYLGDDSDDTQFDELARRAGWQIYSLLDDSVPELYSAGPGEFLSLIANASFVCSDSFHCIAFAILFRRPFAVYDRGGEGSYMSSRLDTLLDKFSLGDRRRSRLSADNMLSIDYSDLDGLIKKERMKFSLYISDVLGGVGQG